MGNHAMQVGMELGLARGLGPAQRSATWLLLKHYNDGTGYCCPKIATLAQAEGVDESAMGRTVFRLMENSCWERRMVGILYHYDLPPAIASTIVAAKVAHAAGVIFDVESHYLSEFDRLGPANNRPHFGSIEHLNSDHGVNDTDHGVNDSDHGVNDTDHGDRSERKKKEVRKEVRKEGSSPREILVPAAMLDHPDTAESVYNTLTIPDAPDPTTQEADMDDATTARAAELQQHEDQIGLQLRDHRNPLDPDTWQHRYDEMNDIRRQRRALEQLLSDQEWHHRAANSGERFSVILAALVHQRWPDFPYRIEWDARLQQMVDAYRAAGRRGRDLLQDTLTASAAPDKNTALILLTARWLEPKEDKPDDDRNPPQTLQQMPAEQADHRVLQTPVDHRRPGEHVQGMQEGQETEDLQEGHSQTATYPPHHQALHQVPANQEPDRLQRRQGHLRRPPPGLQSVLQRPAADKSTVPPDAPQETASPPASPPVPALLETQMAERVLSAQPPSGPPDPAVPGLPR